MKEPTLQAMTLQWAGTNSTSMNVYRNGVLVKTGARDGQYTNTRRFSGPATYTYKVCEAATSKCSNTATATFR
jgi:thermitase